MAEIDGVTYVVKGKYRNGRIEIGTAFSVDAPKAYIQKMIEAGYEVIYSGE